LGVVFEITPPPSSTLTSKPKSPDPDEALVEAWVNRGDAAAFEQLVEQYQGYVFRLALSVLGPGCEGDAQDVTQEVFVRIAGQLQHFRGESRFRTWLHRLALNMAFNCRRRPRWRKPHVDASILDHRPAPGGSDDPYQSAAAAERRRVVSESIDGLPDSLRTVIHLHYWLDVPVEGIASMLRMPAGTVKSHLHRGRKLLFKAIQARGLGHDRSVPGGAGRSTRLGASGRLGRPRVLAAPCPGVCMAPGTGRLA
jgi:RNA polymerase sigma-70 factor (ECF subfamily)